MQVTYINDGKTAFFNDMRFTRDDKSNYYLNSKHSKGNNKRLHVAVWEHYNEQPVPDGCEIHHIDRDKFNNDISNLNCMTQKDHREYHANNMSEETKQKLRLNLIENAVPKSKEWHASPEGLAWHSMNFKTYWANKKPKQYACTQCGKEFESLNNYGVEGNKFCGNNCRSAYRRKMGWDNVARACENCGKEFEINKYNNKRITCSKDCTNQLRQDKNNKEAGKG